MDWLLSAFGSVLSGGATGLIGMAIQRYADYKNKQQDMLNRVEERKHELAVMNAEWQGRLSVAKTEGESARDVADSQTLTASYQGAFDRLAQWDMKNDPWWSKIWLLMADFLRAMVRPGLTVYLCVLTTLIYLEARSLVAVEEITAEDALGLQRRIVETILYLTTTCVLWWFGTRNKQIMK